MSHKFCCKDFTLTQISLEDASITGVKPLMSFQDVTSKIQSACHTAGRDPADVSLIAVSKIQPNQRVAGVLARGHRVFGENRVQEALGKWPEFKAEYENVELHLLGPLQSNKARQAVELFDFIHSVDRIKIAQTISRLAQEIGRCPNLFLQVNTGQEAQKSGILPADVDGFVTECRALDLPVAGLMCIPPVEEEASLHFALLAKMAKRNGLTGLSMGMSADYEKAIAFGATHIRVGSAIFGERVKPQ